MNAIRRLAALALALLLCAAGGARAEYWDAWADRPVVCCEGRAGCEVLQMVMMGSFSAAEEADSLTTRVMAAALSALCEVTDADFAHFCDEFGEQETDVRALYYLAVGNCLRADMRIAPDSGGAAGAARRVLQLFLEPESEPDAEAQMEIIREGMTEDVIATMAAETGLPEDFIAYLTLGSDGHGTAAPGAED